MKQSNYSNYLILNPHKKTWSYTVSTKSKVSILPPWKKLVSYANHSSLNLQTWRKDILKSNRILCESAASSKWDGLSPHLLGIYRLPFEHGICKLDFPRPNSIHFIKSIEAGAGCNDIVWVSLIILTNFAHCDKVTLKYEFLRSLNDFFLVLTPKIC